MHPLLAALFCFAHRAFCAALTFAPAPADIVRFLSFAARGNNSSRTVTASMPKL